MKIDDLFSRLLALLQKNELLDVAAEKLVWLITCYSVAFGLVLAAALLFARQGLVLVRTNGRKLR